MPGKGIKYRQFVCSRPESMILRSGKSINGIGNTQLSKDMQIMVSGDNTINAPHYGYCKSCFSLFAMFEFLEKYHREIRGEERKLNGQTLEQWLMLYQTVKRKLEEFIGTIDNGQCSCDCNKQDNILDGALRENIWHMENLSQQRNYAEFAEYTGYGVDREKYRIYHKNFLTVFDIDEDAYYLIRDYQKIREELVHWLKYFSQSHMSQIESAKQELMKNTNLCKNVIGEIIKFL